MQTSIFLILQDFLQQFIKGLGNHTEETQVKVPQMTHFTIGTSKISKMNSTKHF